MLQQRLNVKLSQRQVLTPGLVQMVGVLALNNLELRDMINNELVENPVLEEIEEGQETIAERAGREGDRERSAEAVAIEGERAAGDPFEEVDFGNYFQEYLDPGYRTASTFEDYDKPSFEHFLASPTTLRDHLMWQVGARSLSPQLRGAVEMLVGNLNEDGYLTASTEELLALGLGLLYLPNRYVVPGGRFNESATRLIEPDVAFVKRGDDWVIVMNDEEMPALRLNAGYRKMMRERSAEREVRDYVKERYRSAIQLLRNLEQRKNTILRTCEVIVQRQGEFLERGVEGLRPMMIKDVAEEIGVHPSTVSRAVANKYVHTPQGVYELRFFFTEAVNGPEGGDLPLLLLKRKVKKLIGSCSRKISFVALLRWSC